MQLRWLLILLICAALQTNCQNSNKSISSNDDFTKLAQVINDGLYGFIDESGVERIPPKYKSASPFNEGYAVVTISGELFSGKKNFINKKGELLDENEYDRVTMFSEGLAKAQIGRSIRYINQQGQTVFSLDYEDASFFSEGLAEVEDQGKSGFINKKGELVIPIIYDEVRSFSEGLAAVEQDSKWGYIDTTGTMVIEPQFSSVYFFSEGLACVQVNKKYGFIDKAGSFVITPQYGFSTSPFSEGYAVVVEFTDKLLSYGGKRGYIDKNGNEVVPLIYENAASFSEGLAKVQKDRMWGFINTKGEEVISIAYSLVGSFSEGYASVKFGDRQGVIDKSGNLIVPFKYEWIGPFSDEIDLK